jgi:hypothetical protein
MAEYAAASAGFDDLRIDLYGHADQPSMRVNLSLLSTDKPKLLALQADHQAAHDELQADVARLKAEHAAGLEAQSLLDLREKLAEADHDLETAQSEQTAAKSAFREAALSKGDTVKAAENIRTADSRVEAANVLVAFLEQMEAQVEQAYSTAWQHRRDAWLADKATKVTARRNANKKNLAGYLVTLAGKVHADGRLLDHLQGLQTRQVHGVVMERLPAPEPIGVATDGPATLAGTDSPLMSEPPASLYVS